MFIPVCCLLQLPRSQRPTIYLLADEYDAFANPNMDPHDYNACKGSGVAGALKAFWAAVKAASCYQYGIQKCPSLESL